MIRQAFVAAILAITVGLPAHADQFAVQLDGPYQGASAGLIKELEVSVIESFSKDGAHYLIVDAPDDGYVQAFVYALGHKAIALNRLEANWTTPAFAGLPLAMRMQFLHPVACEWCQG